MIIGGALSSLKMPLTLVKNFSMLSTSLCIDFLPCFESRNSEQLLNKFYVPASSLATETVFYIPVFSKFGTWLKLPFCLAEFGPSLGVRRLLAVCTLPSFEVGKVCKRDFLLLSMMCYRLLSKSLARFSSVCLSFSINGLIFFCFSCL